MASYNGVSAKDCAYYIEVAVEFVNALRDEKLAKDRIKDGVSHQDIADIKNADTDEALMESLQKPLDVLFALRPLFEEQAVRSGEDVVPREVLGNLQKLGMPIKYTVATTETLLTPQLV